MPARTLPFLIAVGAMVLFSARAFGEVVLETSATPSPALSGQLLTLTVKVKNGPHDITSVVVTNTVPAMTTYVPGSASDGGGEAAGLVTWPAVSVTSNQEIERSFSVTVDSSIGADAVLFFDGMEGGAGNWTETHTVGTDDWDWLGSTPLIGGTSWIGRDIATPTDQRLTTATSIGLPADASLRFLHRYETEAGFDGGIVEISTDGTIWTDLDPQFVLGGYTGSIDCCFDNPLADGVSDRDAYSGTVATTFESIADLDSFSGETVDLRFRMGTDITIDDLGWLLDDVAVVVGDVVSVQNDAAVTSFEGFSATIRGLTLVKSSSAIPMLPLGGVALLAAALLLLLRRQSASG